MTDLQRQKQLLVAEAESQRNDLRRDVFVLRGDLGHFVRRIQFVAVTGAFAWVGMSLFRRARVAAGAKNGKASWVGRLLTGARLATKAWKTRSSFKSRTH
jgi:hypothetical protein